MQNIEHQSRQKRRTDCTVQIRLCLSLLVCFLAITKTSAQQYLKSLVSLDVKEERLSDVLNEISQVGGFYFSYSSEAVPKDSVVSISVQQITIESVLNTLLKGDYEYKEAQNYIILRLAPNRLQLISEDHQESGKINIITGYVVDDLTGKKLPNASIYERSLLLSTLTDENGYFKLKVAKPVSSLSITVSKEYYRDTTVVLLAPVRIDQNNKGKKSYGYRPGDDLQKVERTAMGRFFVSSRQKLQSLNLGGFFANTPFQTSITPGLSTYGSLSGQVINKFSVNVLGGYTSGVKGMELGGGFNINKRDVDYMQAAGIFNLVGGNVRGVQLAGAANSILDSVQGFQAAGLYNSVAGSVQGFQMAGAFNIVKKRVKGVQIAGIGNISPVETKGLQVAGLFNYSRNLKGVQFGFINVADTSSGVSIGVFNFIRDGYNKLLISNNELTNINIAYKMGTAVFHTSIMGGLNVFPDQKAFVFGIGFGHDFPLKNHLLLTTELSSQNVFLGNWKELSNLYRAKALLNIPLSERLGLFVGPAFNVFVNDQITPVGGYKTHFPFANYRGKQFNSTIKGWLGWEVGISLF